MSFANWIREGIAHPRVAIYLKVIAVFIFLGAFSHLASILGFIGGSWVDKPLRIRIADLLLLTTDLVLPWGLWRTRFWAVVAWVAAVVLLQAVPFLLFTEFFAPGPRERTTLYGLLATNAVLLGAFLLLLPRKKGS